MKTRYWLLVAGCLLLLATAICAEAGHSHPEKWYQKTWCEQAGGVLEYVLPDGARVDCLTEGYAIEFDFAAKWAESIGQALYYGIMTGRQPGVVLIMEHPGREQRFLRRLEAVGKKHNIKIWTVSK